LLKSRPKTLRDMQKRQTHRQTEKTETERQTSRHTYRGIVKDRDEQTENEPTVCEVV